MTTTATIRTTVNGTRVTMRETYEWMDGHDDERSARDCARDALRHECSVFGAACVRYTTHGDTLTREPTYRTQA